MLQRVTLLISLLLAVLSGYSARAAAEAIWIDVRSAEEYAAGHVPGAINVPHGVIGEVTADRDQVIYLYCGSGKRAGMAQQALLELGYTEVVNIGGIEQARKARAAVEE